MNKNEIKLKKNYTTSPKKKTKNKKKFYLIKVNKK